MILTRGDIPEKEESGHQPRVTAQMASRRGVEAVSSELFTSEESSSRT